MNLRQVNIPVELAEADGLAKDHDAIQTLTSKTSRSRIHEVRWYGERGTMINYAFSSSGVG
jgi:hypothetical protein